MVDSQPEDLDPPLPPKSPALAATNVRFQLQGTMTRLLWLALVTMGLSGLVVFLCAFLGGPVGLAAWGGWTILGSSIVSIATLIIRTLEFPMGNSLSLSDKSVMVAGKYVKNVLTHEEFGEGWFSPQTKQVFLVRRNGNIVLADVEDAETATALLGNIGVDAAKRTMRIRLGAVDFLNAMSWILGPVFAVYLGETIGSAVNLAGALSLPVAAIVFILQFFLVRRLFGPAHLVIGADGIIVEQRFGSRFVSFEDMASISTSDDHVTIHLVNGESVRARARHLDEPTRAIIEQRVQEALDIRAKRLADPAALAALDRGERTGAAWRESLRGLLDKNRGYRQAVLKPEQIAAVLVDPGAPTDRRIGAAMALAQSGDPDVRPKIRIAAESSANRKVRVALEAIAEGDLENEAIEEAAMEEAAREMKSGS